MANKKQRPRLQRDSDLGYVGYRGGEISKQGGSLEGGWVEVRFDEYQEGFLMNLQAKILLDCQTSKGKKRKEKKEKKRRE
jgi:hypothetical protein